MQNSVVPRPMQLGFAARRRVVVPRLCDGVDMVLKSMLAAAALLAVVVPAQAINKCTGADGKVVLQDMPCADGGGQVLKVRPVGGGSDQSAQDAAGRAQKMRVDNEMAAAVREKRPIVGMTPRQLEDAMGLATVVNTDTSAGGVREQAVYERRNEVWYVYLRGGVVEHVQHRPFEPLPHRHAGPRNQFRLENGRCPLSSEIRDAKMAVDTLTNTPEQRAKAERSLKDMLNCK